MQHSATLTEPRPETEIDWAARLAPFSRPTPARSVLEIVLTAVPFVGLWVLSWAAMSVSYALTLIIAIPAAAFLVRLFLIQHDCGHGALFADRRVNDWVGRVLGVFTFTPYDVWRRSHAIHHAGSGNLDRRGIGDLDTLTITEYRALSPRRRFAYRLYRHPIVMFGIGPAYLFLIEHRVPLGQTRYGWVPWVSAMGTNLGIVAIAAIMMWLVGPATFLLVQVPIVVLAASIGVWLFYVQHQFEDTYWEETRNWSRRDAALYGSSYYDLPGPLRWLTANIGVHHVHHLVSGIPFYRLGEVLRTFPELTGLRRITIADSFRTVRLKLWDEERRRLVSFREAGV